jgi:pSer/pThr/pTyr-binding forkhead associated (FHA) protein
MKSCKLYRMETDMTLSQEYFLDSTLPIFKEDTSRTSKFETLQINAHDVQSKKRNKANAEEMKVVLYLPNHREPIVICNTSTITIGRADKERNAIPTIDLSKENALQLGVSRLHVKLLFMEGRFWLKDMGSTNGTWLNQYRLAPYEIVAIQSGDQIRLGQFTMVLA